MQGCETRPFRSKVEKPEPVYLGRVSRRLTQAGLADDFSIWNGVVGVDDELGRERVPSGQVVRSVTWPYPTS
jgi:hypothetical protein